VRPEAERLLLILPQEMICSGRKKRDNAYWLPRLKAGHPAIYARVTAGEISVRRACAEAGLMREWRAATTKEQREFPSRVKAEATGTSAKPPPVRRAKILIAPDDKLAPATIARINAAMSRQRGSWARITERFITRARVRFSGITLNNHSA